MWGKGRKKKTKNPGINLGQPAEKGRGKKTLVLTLGSALKKGEKKKIIPFFESRFSESNCPTVKSRFPNPIVQAGSTGELKRETVSSDRQTHAQTD
jgi:hypothetical protein